MLQVTNQTIYHFNLTNLIPPNSGVLKQINMKKGIYKLNFSCGRSGDLEGIFVSTKERVDKLVQSQIEVYFGEVMGKHSEVYGPIDEDEIILVTDDKKAVEIVEKYYLHNGTNPFNYTSTNYELKGYDLDDMCIGEIIDILIKQ